MIYEVRKDGYPPEIEASIQAAGYDIYINGKRQPKRRSAKGGSRK